jgi:hypothetical protein
MSETVRCVQCGKEVSVEDADMWCPCGGNWYSDRLIETTNPDGTKSFHVMFGIQPKNPTGMVHGTIE